MERPSELRAVCQAGKGGDPRWYVIHRRYSIYVTWVLLRADVPLWAVSLTMMAFGVVGAALIALSSPAWNVLGFALLYGAFLLDKVDGEIARYRRVQSVHGILLDRFHHRLVEPCLFFGVAIHEIQAGASPWLLSLGAAVALLANAIDENQHLAPYIFLKHLRESGEIANPHGSLQASSRMAEAAAFLRPLKMFRMFIVAVPAFAVCYAVEWASGRTVPAYYLGASAVGLAVYLAFQCVYYFRFKLDAEIAAIQTRFPDLDSRPVSGVSQGVEDGGLMPAAPGGEVMSPPVPLADCAFRVPVAGTMTHAQMVEGREAV